MNKKTKIILENLKQAGLITDEVDLTAGDETNFLFDYMIKNYSYLLENDKKVILLDKDMNKGKIFHKILMKYGKYFLSCPQIIVNKEKLIEENNDFPEKIKEEYPSETKLPEGPCVFVMNHGFKDDLLATMLAAKKRAFLVLGSLPDFFGTADGILCVKNGVIITNRKIQESKSSVVDKAKYALENGYSIVICPEGVWNKSPNKLMLDFWSGFYHIAKKEDGNFYPIVPIVHYIRNTHEKGKNNPIYTIVDNPIVFEKNENKETVINDVRTLMLTWYWLLIEKYGKSTREELVGYSEDSIDAWEDELKKRVITAGKYDIDIETKSDNRKNDIHDELIDVWGPIAEINDFDNEGPKNINELIKYQCIEDAKKLVKTIKDNDFQHRF